jgi:hypothetical protein
MGKMQHFFVGNFDPDNSLYACRSYLGLRVPTADETDVSIATLDLLLLTISEGKVMEELEIVCD